MNAHPDVIDVDDNPSAAASHVDRHEDGLAAFLSARPRLLGIACRMLGSVAEAEDLVQDVWVRWQTADRTSVRHPMAFLTTTTTRLAINVIRSARARRETSPGAALPEPVDTGNDPGLWTERHEALGLAVRLLLETLSPLERAAYVLREAFSHPYRTIADILRIEEAHARQLVTRARERLAGGRRASASPSEQRRLLAAFTAAASTGDLEGLEGLLASDIVATATDGRVGAPAAGRRPRPDRGPRRIARGSARPHPLPHYEPYGACQ